MRASDVSEAGWEAVSGKLRKDRGQRTTYNSLSVFGITGNEEGVLGEQRLGARRIEVIKGLCSRERLSGRQERRALSLMQMTQ